MTFELSLDNDELIIKNNFMLFKIESEQLAKNNKEHLLRLINEDNVGFLFKHSKGALNLASVNGKFIFEIAVNWYWITLEFNKSDVVDVFKQLVVLCEKNADNDE